MQAWKLPLRRRLMREHLRAAAANFERCEPPRRDRVFLRFLGIVCPSNMAIWPAIQPSYPSTHAVMTAPPSGSQPTSDLGTVVSSPWPK